MNSASIQACLTDESLETAVTRTSSSPTAINIVVEVDDIDVPSYELSVGRRFPTNVGCAMQQL